MSDKFIPVIDEERRNYPHPDRRKLEKFTELTSNSERRDGDDRRVIRGVSRDELSYITDVLREEQQTLITFISDKERKKQQIFRFQLASIAILAASLVVSLPLFEKLISSQKLSETVSGGAPEVVSLTLSSLDQFFLALVVFNVIGLIGISLINLTSTAVARQITSIKSNILLAVRQLNCNREAIQDVLTAKLCGSYPVDDWRDSHKIDQWEPANTIYVRHNKFPIDNLDLRNFFLRRHRSWIVRVLSFLFFPMLIIYRRKCKNSACLKSSKVKCFKIRNTIKGDWKHYSFDKYNDVDISETDKLPKFMLLRVLLLGYRAAYIENRGQTTINTYPPLSLADRPSLPS